MVWTLVGYQCNLSGHCNESNAAWNKTVLVCGAMRLRELEKIAEDMGVHVNHVLWLRRRFLWDEFCWYLHSDTDPITWDVIHKPMIESILKELHQLKQDMVWHNKPKKEGEITEEMKERAKAYPVTRLVEFTRGRAKCLDPNHLDKNPSMALLTRKNACHCYGCGKTFDSIDIIMIQSGKSFFEAIRTLCQG